MATDFDSEALRELCSNFNLLEYASQSMDFVQRGTNFATHCPRHIDKTPSLFINPENNLFYCFSCHVGGNILNWLIVFEKLPFTQAIEKLGELTGKNIDSLKQCSAMCFYQDLARVLNKPEVTPPIRKILNPSEIEKYRDAPPQEWVDEGISPEIMKKYQIRIDDRMNRIVYPVYDNNGNLIGFKGRTRYANYKDLGIQKYMNYQKIGTTDFFEGMKENKESILQHNEAIIFEGIKSGMKVEAWGYDYWLASETSHLNDEQILILIKLGIKDVTIAFDNDVKYTDILKNVADLKRYVNVFVVRDTGGLLGSKSEKLSPCDKGRKIWETLYSERKKV